MANKIQTVFIFMIQMGKLKSTETCEFCEYSRRTLLIFYGYQYFTKSCIFMVYRYH